MDKTPDSPTDIIRSLAPDPPFRQVRNRRALRRVQDAEQLGHVCLQHAGRFCLTSSPDGLTLLLAADILTEARFLAVGLANDPALRQGYIDRFVHFIESET